MNTRYCFLLALLSVTAMSAGAAVGQILNGGFEDWSSGEPANWQTTNTPCLVNTTKSDQVHAGCSALLYLTSKATEERRSTEVQMWI